MDRAYYSKHISDFCQESQDQILGQMTRHHGFDLTDTQRDAWMEQIYLLQEILATYSGKIYFEFSIPRMGRRIDALVVIDSVIFVIEFKVGASEFLAAALDQVTDYALDLRNFHEGSHEALIAPVLVSTETGMWDGVPDGIPEDKLFAPIKTNAEGLASVLDGVLRAASGDPLDVGLWESSGYKPTPTIIEATLALYNGHSVAEISRSDAGAINLSKTSSLVTDIIRQSRDEGEILGDTIRFAAQSGHVPEFHVPGFRVRGTEPLSPPQLEVPKWRLKSSSWISACGSWGVIL